MFLYINTLKASYDFYEYYKKSSSELILYYLTNDTIISLDKKPEAEVAKVFIWAKTTLQPIITAVEIPIND